jgi:hypothetical protein
MSDAKRVPLNPTPTPLPPSQRATAISAALATSLLPDLSRMVCAYAVRYAHRFDAADAPPHIALAPDGLSFDLKQLPVPRLHLQGERLPACGEAALPDEDGDPSPGHQIWCLWSTQSLATGALRWTVHLAPGRTVWVGLADVRTRARGVGPDGGMLVQAVSVGDLETFAYSYNTIEAVPKAVREQTHYKPVHDKWGARIRTRNPPLALQCTYRHDDSGYWYGNGTGSLRMEIAGEPEAGAVVFEALPEPQYLVPIVVINTITFGPSGSQRPDPPTFRLHSEDE